MSQTDGNNSTRWSFRKRCIVGLITLTVLVIAIVQFIQAVRTIP